mgnify:CR=1 FL=1
MSLFYGLRTAKERSPNAKKLIARYVQTMARGWIIAIAVLISPGEVPTSFPTVEVVGLPFFRAAIFVHWRLQAL